jgi:3-(3-hydroxy-phenyl)propionate hydroxylase
MSKSDRVVIVGAGPVGLSCALFLVTKGIDVIVLEAEDALPGDMRASTFHPATLDMLRDFDIARQLTAQGFPAPQWQFARWDNGDAVIWDLTTLSDVTAHPFRLQCEQFKLTRTILAVLSGHPRFEIVFGATVEGLRQDSDGVTVIADLNGRQSRFDGRYLVGADGAKSQVRKSVGLDLKGETYPRTSITVSVDFPFEDHLKGLLPVSYVWTENDHFSLMRARDGWRTGYSPALGQSVETSLSDDYIQWHLQRILPTGRDYKVTHRGAYTIHRRVVDNFRAGRVLLAGDAAHLNSPSGGMGMNSGIHDASNLADKLHRVISGEPESLLDLYARQRRTIAVEDVQAQSDTNYRRHRETDPAKREIYWADLKMTAADPSLLREFLLASSMIKSVRRSGSIE